MKQESEGTKSDLTRMQNRGTCIPPKIFNKNIKSNVTSLIRYYRLEQFNILPFDRKNTTDRTDLHKEPFP